MISRCHLHRSIEKGRYPGSQTPCNTPFRDTAIVRDVASASALGYQDGRFLPADQLTIVCPAGRNRPYIVKRVSPVGSPEASAQFPLNDYYFIAFEFASRMAFKSRPIRVGLGGPTYRID